MNTHMHTDGSISWVYIFWSNQRHVKVQNRMSLHLYSKDCFYLSWLYHQQLSKYKSSWLITGITNSVPCFLRLLFLFFMRGWGVSCQSSFSSCHILSSFLCSVVHIMVKVIISSCGLMQKETWTHRACLEA